jgi:hypothetical protein
MKQVKVNQTTTNWGSSSSSFRRSKLKSQEKLQLFFQTFQKSAGEIPNTAHKSG